MGKMKPYKLIVWLLLLLTFLFPIQALAVSASDLQKQKDYYAAQAAAAKAAAAAKQQQAAEVQQQISTLDGQISSMQNTINATEGQINDTQSAIDDLSAKIKKEEDNLAIEKDKMNKLLASWYMESDNNGLMVTLMSSNNLSDVIDQQQYYDSIKQQISASTDKITEVKNQLNEQKNKQEGQLTYLNDLKSNQQAQKNSLQKNKNYKDALLTDTTNAIADLKTESAQASAKAAELTKQIQKAYCEADGGQWNSSAGTCYRPVKTSSGPVKHRSGGGPQIEVPYYSQQDSRWASVSLGNSGVSIGDYGCLITSFAMVASFFGLGKTPLNINNESTFTGDGSFLSFNGNMGNLQNYRYRVGINYSEIDSQLSRGNPVIVGVHMSSYLDHWIVLTGGNQQSGYSWNDPYPWSNPPTYSSFFAMRTFD